MTARTAARGLGTRVFGIDVRLDPSWGIIAALVAALLALRVFPDMLPDARPAVLWAMAVVTVAGIGLSIVLHELGHTLAARGFGIGVRAITLFLFGGVALLEREARTPLSEFLIAIAGPAVSVGLVLLFVGAAGLPGLPAPAATVFSYLALFNGVVVGFNMLPAFPLDGGRVLKALLWRIRGDAVFATRVTARLGEILAVLLMGAGFLSVLAGRFGGLWWIAIGFYLLTIARAARKDAEAGVLLRGLRVADVMTAGPVTVEADAPVDWFVETLLASHPHRFIPVLRGAEVAGAAGLPEAMRHPRAAWGRLCVADIMRPRSRLLVVPPGEDLLSALRAMQQAGEGRMLVVGPEGLLGMLTMKDVLAHLEFRARLGG